MIKLLTQDNCAQCTALKNYLDLGLRKAYDEHIEIVHRQTHPSEFEALVEAHQIMSTPALIAEDGDILRNCSIAAVKPFLDKHIQL